MTTTDQNENVEELATMAAFAYTRQLITRAEDNGADLCFFLRYAQQAAQRQLELCRETRENWHVVDRMARAAGANDEEAQQGSDLLDKDTAALVTLMDAITAYFDTLGDGADEPGEALD